jgi:hypothetical protein
VAQIISKELAKFLFKTIEVKTNWLLSKINIGMKPFKKIVVS